MPKFPASPQHPASVSIVAPAPRSSFSSAWKPMTECWWQCGWTTAVTSDRSGTFHPVSGAGRVSGRVSSSATVFVAPATAFARGSSGKRSSRSERSTAVHDGSSPTIGIPLTANGPRTWSRFSRRLRAPSSWPVLIQVRPQQACWSGTITS
ncbi:hypothetical protein D3C74_314260 [compost metagenome]